ncbi:MAG: hypothetical protein ABIK09_17780 [Pseudomonadota bacterium]
MRKLLGFFLLLQVSCAPVEVLVGVADAEDDGDYTQVSGAIGAPALSIIGVDPGITAEFSISNWVYPLIYRELTCYVDGGAYVGGQADGTTEGTEYTFLTVPKGMHNLCCVLTEDDEELSNCEATACTLVVLSILCDSTADPICDDGNPLSAEACLWDAALEHRKCVYGPIDVDGICLSKFDCDCNGPAGQGLCLGDQCVPCGACVDHADCDDGDPCTFGWCTADDSADGCHYCRMVPVHDAGCCDPSEGAGACEDGDVCTLAACTPETFNCAYTPTSIAEQIALGIECCDLHEDCQAGGQWEEMPQDNPATLDYCQNGQCVHILQPCYCECPDWEEPCTGSCLADWNPCTEDLCLDCVCQHPWIPGCCVDDAACVDDLTCTYNEACVDNECVYEAWDWCCDSPLDCDDGNPCTVDLCVNHACHRIPLPGVEGCCAIDDHCDDWNDCTLDDCTLDPGEETGICEYIVNYEPGGGGICCGVDGDCVDGNSNTVDLCIEHHCHNVPVPWCCGSGDSCNDGNLCTSTAATPWTTATRAGLVMRRLAWRCCVSTRRSRGVAARGSAMGG